MTNTPDRATFTFKGNTPVIIHDPMPGHTDAIFLVYRDVTNDNLWGFTYTPLGGVIGTPSQLYNFQSKYSPSLVAMNSTMYIAFSDKKKSNYISVSHYTTGWTNYKTYSGTSVGAGVGAAPQNGQLAISWVEAGQAKLGEALSNNLTSEEAPVFSTSRLPAIASDGSKNMIMCGRWGTTNELWFSIGFVLSSSLIGWSSPIQVKDAFMYFDASDPNNGYPCVCYSDTLGCYMAAYRSAQSPTDYEFLIYYVSDNSWSYPFRIPAGDAGSPPSMVEYRTSGGSNLIVFAYTNNKSYLSLIWLELEVAQGGVIDVLSGRNGDRRVRRPRPR